MIAARVLHMKTEKYAESKTCNGLDGERSLSSMPQLRAVLDESYRELDAMMAYTAGVEDRLNECLRGGIIPDADLVDAIAVCKIRCIDVAVQRVHTLRLEVGSYALMHGTGFELVDMFLCCKFAEGDSRILQQKLARDRLKAVAKGGVGAAVAGLFDEEGRSALLLASKLKPAGRDLTKLSVAMDENWRAIYGLANLIEERHIRDGVKSAFLEPVVERLAPASVEFDGEWKEKI